MCDRLIDSKELSQILGISYGTVRNRLVYARDLLPVSVKYGRKRMFRVSDVQKFINNLSSSSKKKCGRKRKMEQIT